MRGRTTTTAIAVRCRSTYHLEGSLPHTREAEQRGCLHCPPPAYSSLTVFFRCFLLQRSKTNVGQPSVCAVDPGLTDITPKGSTQFVFQKLSRISKLSGNCRPALAHLHSRFLAHLRAPTKLHRLLRVPPSASLHPLTHQPLLEALRRPNLSIYLSILSVEASASQKRPVARTSVVRDSDVFSCRLTSIDCTAGLEVYPVSHQLTQKCHTQEL